MKLILNFRQRLVAVTIFSLIGISLNPVQSQEESQPFEILTGHTDNIKAIVFSADSKLLISGGRDSTLKVWDINTQKIVRTLSTKSEGITSIALSSDHQTVVSGDIDHSVKIWNFQTGKLLITLNGHSQPVETVAITGRHRKRKISLFYQRGRVIIKKKP